MLYDDCQDRLDCLIRITGEIDVIVVATETTLDLVLPVVGRRRDAQALHLVE